MDKKNEYSMYPRHGTVLPFLGSAFTQVNLEPPVSSQFLRPADHEKPHHVLMAEAQLEYDQWRGRVRNEWFAAKARGKAVMAKRKAAATSAKK